MRVSDEGCDRRLATEGGLAREALEQDAGEGVHVGAAVHILALHLLGGDVVGRTKHVAGSAVGLSAGEPLRDTEVRQVDVLGADRVARHEHVARLHIAVYQPAGVGGVERIRDRSQKRHGPGRVERAPKLQQPCEIGSLHVAHRDVEDAGRLARLVDGHDVRVLDGGGPARLVEETATVARIVRVARGQELERDAALQTRIGGAVDHAHSAGAHERLDPVAGELGADTRVVRAGHAATSVVCRNTLAAVLPDLKPGARIGPYRLGERLGEGAVGIVVKAERDTDGVPVALKVLRPELAPSEVFLRRFEHEVRVARELRHPNLVPVLDAGEADGARYLAARFVAGRSLSSRLRADGALSVADTVSVAADVAAGLTALHRLGLVHRDVKPSNVLMENGRALLTDFGLAKGAALTVLTRSGQLVGTPQYLAPELLEGGGEASAASDLYALGCVVFECLSGRPPFTGTALEVALSHLDDEPPDPRELRPELGEELARVSLLALAKDPAQRPRTPAMYAHLLRASAAGHGVSP